MLHDNPEKIVKDQNVHVNVAHIATSKDNETF
jgi:hypothetical protein